ncbi:MAG: hypothetical protein ACFFDI_01075 [Promethearchaeota archaeon]
MKKYKVVEINCHKNIVRKIPIYSEHYRNIYQTQLEEKLNHLVKAGWTHFEIIIDGNKQQKVLVNYQGESVLSQKSPVKSIRDNGENPVESIRQGNSRDILTVSKSK